MAIHFADNVSSQLFFILLFICNACTVFANYIHYYFFLYLVDCFPQLANEMLTVFGGK
jgi:hypothetical protein